MKRVTLANGHNFIELFNASGRSVFVYEDIAARTTPRTRDGFLLRLLNEARLAGDYTIHWSEFDALCDDLEITK
jgi:hypothetical protein